MEGTRKYMIDLIKTEKSISFEKIFDVCDDSIHAIFLFLNILELVQLNYMNIMTGNGTNNFIIEYNEHRPEDKPEEAIGDDADL
jgi:segregation and condensation protein A